MTDPSIEVNQKIPEHSQDLLPELWKQLEASSRIVAHVRAKVLGDDALVELSNANKNLAKSITSMARELRCQSVPTLPDDDMKTSLEILQSYPQIFSYFSLLVNWLGSPSLPEEHLVSQNFSRSSLDRAQIIPRELADQRPRLKKMGLLDVSGRTSDARWKFTKLGVQIGMQLLNKNTT